MSDFFPWYQILLVHPVTKDVDGWETLPLEFIAKVGKALQSGELKVYSQAGALLSTPTDAPRLNHYLYSNEVNNWFRQHFLPYQWHPIPKKSLPLKERKCELQQEAALVVANMRAKGISESHINKTSVATEIAKREKFSNYEASTIERWIEAKWWKKT